LRPASALALAQRALVPSRALAVVRTALQRWTPGGRVRLVLYALYTSGLFGIFLVATLPHQLVVRRMLDRAVTAPFAVEVGAVRLGWTLAYTFDELRLLPVGGDPNVPLLAASNVRVAPSFLGLLRGRPYPLGVHAHLYDGTLAATVDLRPADFEVSAVLGDVDVARYAGLRLFMEGVLRGRLGGTVELRGDARKPAAMNGHIELRAAGLALEGGSIRGIAVPALHFSELRIAGTVRNGRLELSDLAAAGQEVNLSSEGTVFLQQPLGASLVNMALTLQPAADVPPELRLALSLLPGEVGADGARKFRLVGSLAQPRVQ
jgi:type II secretion system protein N